MPRRRRHRRSCPPTILRNPKLPVFLAWTAIAIACLPALCFCTLISPTIPRCCPNNYHLIRFRRRKIHHRHPRPHLHLHLHRHPHRCPRCRMTPRYRRANNMYRRYCYTRPLRIGQWIRLGNRHGPGIDWLLAVHFRLLFGWSSSSSCCTWTCAESCSRHAFCREIM